MADQGCMSGVIKDILTARTRKRIQNKKKTYKHASVLIPLLMEDGACRVVFTERTHKVEHHKGQISFPGGGVDETDPSFEATAIREAHEEIGLLPEDVEILGRLDDTLTLVSNYVVHPVVGRIKPKTDFVVNPHEVERIIRVPLEVFLRAGAGDRDHWVEYEGVKYRTAAYQYKADLIWGATARIMEKFVEIIGPNLPLHSEKQ